MKKTSLLLAAAAVVSLVGCGGTGSTSSSSQPNNGLIDSLNLVDTYTTVFSETAATFDYLATGYASDSEVTVNLVDGLVEYDKYG